MNKHNHITHSQVMLQIQTHFKTFLKRDQYRGSLPGYERICDWCDLTPISCKCCKSRHLFHDLAETKEMIIWYKVCKDCRLKLARWIFLSHFWPLQNGVVFFEALGTITKIFSSSKPSHRIKLRCSKLSVGQTEDFDIETQCWDLHCILESISSTFYAHILRQYFGA